MEREPYAEGLTGKSQLLDDFDIGHLDESYVARGPVDGLD